MSKVSCSSFTTLYLFIGLLFIAQFILVWSVQKESSISNHFRVESDDIQSGNFSSFGISLVMPSPFQLLSYINYHIVLWNEYHQIIVPVPVTSEDDIIFKQYRSNALYPSRVRVVSYRVDMESYPINALRNYGLSLSDTSHIVFARPLQIPSHFLYDSLLSIPQKQLNNPKHAFIIPEFSMTFSSVPCEHWYECDDRAVFLASINKLQLKSCSKWGMCESYGDANGNNYMFSDWYSTNPGNYSTPLSCWGYNQDGVLMVKRSDDLPLFDERIFEDMSHSKEWLMELYYKGYHFDVLSQGWFVNVASSMPISDESSQHTSRLKRVSGISPRLIEVIRSSITKKYKEVRSIPVCQK